MDLNPAQREAVYTLHGPLLVLAGAGTGKTRVVTYRIAELIRTGTPPHRILAVTFTNKAADEMQQRTAALLGKRLKQRPEISTFHSLCVRILRRNIKALGYPTEFAICDRGDQESVARTALRELRMADTVLSPGDLLYLVGRWKSAGVRPAQAVQMAETDKEHLAASAYRRYQEKLRAAGALDFDDLLLCTEELFASHPAALKAEAGRFDHILVDEYQDTNGPQYRIIKALASGHRNLCVVGDDDQSIYGWRGAEVTHILNFKRDWPDAKVVRLETNYRSTHEIVSWANRLIAFNRLRHGKTLRATRAGEPPRVLQLEDEQAEAETVVQEIAARLKNHRRKPSDFAILCRTNEQPRAFETELRRARVPYVILGGKSFFDRKEVRDVLAYLKTIAYPHDEASLLRVINVPPRGLGPSAVRRLNEWAAADGIGLWELLERVETRDGLSRAAMEGAVAFRRLIQMFRAEAARLPVDRLLTNLLSMIDYRAELDRIYDDVADRDARWASVEELVNAAAQFAKRNAKHDLAGFLQELVLTSTDDKEDQLEKNAVALMTMHAAKGLEFPEVYVVGMEEGILPHHRAVKESETAVDEERRLCYVGVTRAQSRLTLTLALSRMKWGKPRPTVPSRFLFELTGKAQSPNYEKAKSHVVEQAAPSKRGGVRENKRAAR